MNTNKKRDEEKEATPCVPLASNGDKKGKEATPCVPLASNGYKR